ncbi:MAG: HupE/UreJ family protein [Deltaproteobacteria bacterium]|nr:HupE/UreJ family protein [Deltaproteobacteria bacterium]
MNRRVLAWAALVLLALASSPKLAEAHTKSASYSHWRLDDGGAEVRFRLPLLELTRFPPELDWPSYLASRLELLAGDRPCTPSTPVRVRDTAPGWAVFRWHVACPDAGPRTIRSRILDDVLASHLHFARVATPEGGALERVLVSAAPEWPLDAKGEESMGTSFLGYVKFGIEHILAGWDHLAFVAALLLLSRSLREVATLVTSFTLAHSVTLALAVLGVIRPEAADVEILIGFSIALVAAEDGWLLAGRPGSVPRTMLAVLVLATGLSLAGSGLLPPLAWIGLALFSLCHFGLLERTEVGRDAILRAIVAFAFGLIHGLGFAGVLMEVELPTDRLVPALLGFNVGVEIAQLGIVALLWPVLRLLARWEGGVWYVRLAAGGSAAILALGVHSVVVRNWG